MPLQQLFAGLKTEKKSDCNASLFIDVTATKIKLKKNSVKINCNASLSADAFYLIISIKTAADKTLAVFKANYF